MTPFGLGWASGDGLLAGTGRGAVGGGGGEGSVFWNTL